MAHPLVQGGFLAAAAIGVTVLLSGPRADGEGPATTTPAITQATACNPAYKPSYYSRFPRVHLADSFRALERGERCSRVGAPLPVIDSNEKLHRLRLDQA